MAAYFLAPQVIFLSTLSLRRATSLHRLSGSSSSNFYPRSPCGERLWPQGCLPSQSAISIHALLAESDGHVNAFHGGDLLFLSTLSLRRATGIMSSVAAILPISIHALLAESDAFRSPRIALIVDFYPRSPCGERLLVPRRSAAI